MNQVVSIENAHQSKLSVLIEPWLEDHILKNGDKIKIDITFSQEGELELIYQSEQVIVALWPSCACKIYINDILCSK